MSVLSFTAQRPRSVTWDRQRIATSWLYLLLSVAILPVGLALLRLLALISTQPTGILAIGEWLNSQFQLSWVSYNDRDVVLYILLLPVAAFLTAVMRLTLGIRVLGFRAILIAIGFQEIGVLPCLLLIFIIAVTVVLVRPLMRRSGLPLFARVAVILCIVAMTMVLGLLTGAWLDSPTLWSMAFFPVVILAMLAESIAKTVAHESIAVAVWRTGMTIALALLITLISQITLLQELLMSCPELLVTMLVLTVFVAEFLDLRLLEDFRPGVDGRRKINNGKPDVVILRNRFPEAPVQRLVGQPPRRYRRAALQPLIDQLREQDFNVTVLEADSTLPATLSTIAKKASRPTSNGLAVLNCAGGVQGAACLVQVPAMCEMLGVSYSGPLPQAGVLMDDRFHHLRALRAAGLQVPKALSYAEALRVSQSLDSCTLWVRGRFAADHRAKSARGTEQFQRAYNSIVTSFDEVLVEQRPAGQPITAVVLHPEGHAFDPASRCPSPLVLPLLKRDGKRRAFRAADELSSEACHAIEDAAVRAASALGCRDFARVDLYCTEEGKVTISRVQGIEPLTRSSAAGEAADLAGIGLAGFAEAIIKAVLWRHMRTEKVPELTPRPSAKTPSDLGITGESSYA